MLQESTVDPAGVLVDLGVQLTGAEEKNIGLSYFEAVTLDGRFDPSRGVSAKTWLQNVTQVESLSDLMEGPGCGKDVGKYTLPKTKIHSP